MIPVDKTKMVVRYTRNFHVVFLNIFVCEGIAQPYNHLPISHLDIIVF
uniref:Uncharacterized protein n=1 Tax=Rhizophora mucronata TaxID=61149 RepID=A0A2P2JDY5_RHIMU